MSDTTTRSKPVHHVFDEEILQKVYAPRLRGILEARPESYTAAAATFNDHFGTGVTASTFKHWCERLGWTISNAVIVNFGDNENAEAD